MEPFRKDIQSVKGIGEKRAQALNKLGVFSLLDLISYFPRRYEDRSSVKPAALVQDGESACISAVVADEPRLSRIRRGLDVVRFRVYDDSAEALCPESASARQFLPLLRQDGGEGLPQKPHKSGL